MYLRLCKIKVQSKMALRIVLEAHKVQHYGKSSSA